MYFYKSDFIHVVFSLAHKYHNRHEFLRDIQQIVENCTIYNGLDSPYTQKAESMVRICKEAFDVVSKILKF